MEYQYEFANQMNAELVYFDCGHYIHYFKSNEMYLRITKFVDTLFSGKMN